VLVQTAEEYGNVDTDESKGSNLHFFDRVAPVVAEHDKEDIKELWYQARTVRSPLHLSNLSLSI